MKQSESNQFFAYIVEASNDGGQTWEIHDIGCTPLEAAMKAAEIPWSSRLRIVKLVDEGFLDQNTVMNSSNEIKKESMNPEINYSKFTGSRLFRVQVSFDTVIYAENEKDAKMKVRYGMGEIDDGPVSVSAISIESKDDLPPKWSTICLPWHGPVNKTIGKILSENK